MCQPITDEHAYDERASVALEVELQKRTEITNERLTRSTKLLTFFSLFSLYHRIMLNFSEVCLHCEAIFSYRKARMNFFKTENQISITLI